MGQDLFAYRLSLQRRPGERLSYGDRLPGDLERAGYRAVPDGHKRAVHRALRRRGADHIAGSSRRKGRRLRICGPLRRAAETMASGRAGQKPADGLFLPARVSAGSATCEGALRNTGAPDRKSHVLRRADRLFGFVKRPVRSRKGRRARGGDEAGTEARVLRAVRVERAEKAGVQVAAESDCPDLYATAARDENGAPRLKGSSSALLRFDPMTN